MDRKILIDLLDDFAFGSHDIEQTADRITELYKQEKQDVSVSVSSQKITDKEHQNLMKQLYPKKFR